MASFGFFIIFAVSWRSDDVFPGILADSLRVDLRNLDELKAGLFSSSSKTSSSAISSSVAVELGLKLRTLRVFAFVLFLSLWSIPVGFSSVNIFAGVWSHELKGLELYDKMVLREYLVGGS